MIILWSVCVPAVFVIVIGSAVRHVSSCIASPHPFREKLANGNMSQLLWIRGGAEFHYMTDDKNYTIMQNAQKQLVYAMRDPSSGCMVPSRMMVGVDSPDDAGIDKGILPDEAQRQEMCGRMCETFDDDGNPRRLLSTSKPTSRTGGVAKRKNLVICIRFRNHRQRNLPSISSIDILFNKQGGDAIIAPTGSVRDVYTQSSFGKFSLESTVIGWVNLKKTEQYYANGKSGLSNVFVEALHEALQQIDTNPNVDFRDFDADGDGTVDALTILHSGYGAEWGGTDMDGQSMYDRIWSHKWSLRSSQHWYSSEGIRVNKYNVNPSLWGIRGDSIGRIGVIAHEIGHVLGLPDLYDGVPVDGVTGSGIGSYGLMGNSWGFDGSQYYPPIMSPWSREQVGWLEARVIRADGKFDIVASALAGDIYRIDLGVSEYLLIENRQRAGFDTKLPQGGLAIWHIDKKAGHRTSGFPGQSGWPRNGRHYHVALLQADGRYQLERGYGRGDGGDVFHGDGVTSIGPSISIEDGPFPNTDAYQGGIVTRTGVRIHSISRSRTRMSFSVTFGNKTPKPSPNPTPLPSLPPTLRPTTIEKVQIRELRTQFLGGNGASGSMFDILPKRDITLLGMAIHTSSSKTLRVEVWTKLGTHVRFDTDPNVWTKIAEAEMKGQGLGNRSPIPRQRFAPLPMKATERRALYVIVRAGGGVRYTNGRGVGTPQATNSDLQLFEGIGKSFHFGQTHKNRRWNGVLSYVLGHPDQLTIPTQPPMLSPTPRPTLSQTPRPSRPPSIPHYSSKIKTTFVGGSEQAGIMFDLVSFHDITVTGMELHISLTRKVTVEIWTKQGSHKGFEEECGAWTKVGTASVTGMGKGIPTLLPHDGMDPVSVSRFRVQAFYVTIKTSAKYGMRYSRGTGRGKVVAYDGNLAVLEGVGKSYPCGDTFRNRIFNGVLHYVTKSEVGQIASLPTNPPTIDPTGRLKELTTTFIGGKQGAGIMFDVFARKNITIVGMRLNVDTTSEVDVELWTKSNTFVGYENNSSLWTRVMTGTVTGKGRGHQSHISSGMGEVSMGRGERHAIYVTLKVKKMRYTNGKSFGEAGSNSDLVVSKGVGKTYPFGSSYDDRVWNGVLTYVLADQ